jgi:hypothetical protein
MIAASASPRSRRTTEIPRDEQAMTPMPTMRLLSISALLLAMPLSSGAAQARDTDRDGIADAVDRCPMHPETVNGHMDHDGCPDSIESLFDAARAEIDRFWQSETSNLGGTYQPPSGVTVYTSEIQTPCGAAERGNAFYCGRDRGLYFDLDFLADEFQKGDFAPVVIVAHEWGHLTQHSLNSLDSIPLRRELQADCFAGAFAQFAEKEGMLEPGDLQEAIHELFEAGRTDVLWLDPQAHGSGGERADAFHWGYRNAAPACTESIFLRKAGGGTPKFEVEAFPPNTLGDLVPLSVGEFTLVDVRRRNDLISENAPDALLCKYRGRDGTIMWFWVIAHVSATVMDTYYDRNVSHYQQRGWALVEQDVFTNQQQEPVSRWARFSKDARDIVMWTNKTLKVTLSAEGPSGQVYDFARRHRW